MKQKTALVVHAETETSLAVIRSLGRQGIPITASSNTTVVKGLWSKYVTHRLRAPSSENPQEVVDWLIENAKNNLFEIFLPVGDDYMWIAAHYNGILSKYMKIPIASKEVVDITLFKEQTYKSCERYSIPYPKTYFIKSIDEVNNLANKIEYPVIIKSRISFGVTPRIKGVLIKNSKELLRKYVLSKPADFLRGYNHIEYPLIQEFIPGGMRNLYTVSTFMNKKSHPVAIFCGRKIRQLPVDAGSCCMAECSYDEQAIKTSIKLLKKIGWCGAAEVEIKKDERTGEFKIIEINPRPYSWIWLAVQCGIDIPYLWYRSAIEDIDDETKISKSDLAYVYYLRDTIWLLTQLRNTHEKTELLKEHTAYGI